MLTPLTQKRRRAQNRRSQRAYRERREAQLQTLQDKIDDVEMENEKLRAAYESLRNEVTALKTGAIPALPTKVEDPDSAYQMGGQGQVPGVGYLSFQGVYHMGANQQNCNNSWGWGN